MFSLVLNSIKWFARSLFISRKDLILENIALRQQLAILKKDKSRPFIKNSDRLFWITLCRLWKEWRSALAVVSPETVIAWHRKGYNYFWTKKVKPVGRPKIKFEWQNLIKKMATENGWGASRIHGELLKLGIKVSEMTILRYMPKNYKPPKQTWKNFINNHLHETVAIDFFTTPTIFFKRIWVLLVFSHMGDVKSNTSVSQ